MTGAELAELVETLRRIETDTASVEAKRARHELPKRLWETLSAFANSPGGGVLILGLEESSGFVASGVSDVKKVQADLGSLMGTMDPPLRAVIDAHRLEGVDLVVAEVPELPAERKPCYYPGAGLTNGASVRVADGDRKLSQYEVGLLLAARSQPRDDEQPEPRAYERDLDAELVEAILARLRDRPGSVFRDLDDRTALETLRVLVPGEDGGLVPSVGGLLALGRYPQQFFPALALTLVVYPTPRVGEPGPGGERFLDNAELEGPIPRLVPRALDVLRRNMRERSIVTGVGRQTLWEYPEVALREAIVNALAHRDLSAMARGTPVQVQMFPDRLTITNPGGLFGPVTLDRLGEQGLAAARNQTLMKLLEDVPAPGEGGAVSENRGSGIGAMLAALRHAGMRLAAEHRSWADRFSADGVLPCCAGGRRSTTLPTGSSPACSTAGWRRASSPISSRPSSCGRRGRGGGRATDSPNSVTGTSGRATGGSGATGGRTSSSCFRPGLSRGGRSPSRSESKMRWRRTGCGSSARRGAWHPLPACRATRGRGTSSWTRGEVRRRLGCSRRLSSVRGAFE